MFCHNVQININWWPVLGLTPVLAKQARGAKDWGQRCAMSKMCFVGLFILFLVKSTEGYPDGAPERACFFMIPRHTHPQSGRPIFKQAGGTPYNISLSSLTYTPNRPLRGEASVKS